MTIQSGLAGSLAKLTLGEVDSEKSAYENNLRRANWEAGKIDYLGKFLFHVEISSLIWVCFSASIRSKGKNSEIIFLFQNLQIDANISLSFWNSSRWRFIRQHLEKDSRNNRESTTRSCRWTGTQTISHDTTETNKSSWNCDTSNASCQQIDWIASTSCKIKVREEEGR